MDCFFNIIFCSLALFLFIGLVEYLISKKMPDIKRYMVALAVLILVRALFFCDLYAYSDADRAANIVEFKQKSDLYTQEAIHILEEIGEYKPWITNPDVRDKEIAERSIATLIAYLAPKDFKSKIVASSIILLEQAVQRSLQDGVFFVHKLELMKECIETANFFNDMVHYLETRAVPYDDFLVADLHQITNETRIYRNGICYRRVVFEVPYFQYEGFSNFLSRNTPDEFCFEMEDGDDYCIWLDSMLDILMENSKQINFPVLDRAQKPLIGIHDPHK